MKVLAIAVSAVTMSLLLTGPTACAQMASTTTKPIVPLQLKPQSSAPITLHVTDDSKIIYQTIGKAAGLTILFDSDYTPKHVQVDITNASLKDSLRIVGELTSTFYKPLTPDTIFVAQNTARKHSDLDDVETETFILKNTTQQADAYEISTAIRNTLPPEARVFLVPSKDAIVVRTTPEQLVVIQSLLNDFDRPKKTYRLTYTVTEMDGGKHVGTQHFAMVMVSGQQTRLKQGSKVPIATGTYNSGANSAVGVQTQFTYLDVGMNFDATMEEMGSNGRLRFSVEQSSIALEASGVGPQNPIVRQTSLAGEATLAPGKPMMLGSVDIPASTRHLDIEVVMEPLP